MQQRITELTEELAKKDKCLGIAKEEALQRGRQLEDWQESVEKQKATAVTACNMQAEGFKVQIQKVAQEMVQAETFIAQETQVVATIYAQKADKMMDALEGYSKQLLELTQALDEHDEKLTAQMEKNSDLTSVLQECRRAEA